MADARDRIEPAVEILERLGDVHHVLAHHQEAQEAFERALSLTAADLRLQLSRLHRKIGATWQIQRQYDTALVHRRRGLVDEVRSYIERTLAAAEAGGMLEYLAVAKANQGLAGVETRRPR